MKEAKEVKQDESEAQEGSEERSGNPPEKKFGAGAVSASIWRNEAVRKDGEPVAYYSVSLQRRYKDKEGNWKSGSLRTADLPKAMLVLQKAYEYLVLKGDEPDEDVF